MKVNLKQLESFVWVADLGSFRAAAERLNTTQPNISARITALESNLGVVLMQRDAGSVRLTSKGSDLLARARDVLSAAECIIEATEDKTLIEGSLRVGVTEMVAHTWLNEFLDHFKQQYPNVLLELTVDLAVNLESELSQANLDLSFQSGPLTRSEDEGIPIGDFPMVWVCSKRSSHAKSLILQNEDLAKQPVLTHAKNTIAYQELVKHIASLSLNDVTLVPSSNLMIAVEMVKDDYGVGLLLEPLVEQYLKQGKLIKLGCSWKPKELAFFAKYNKHRASKVVEQAALMGQHFSLKASAKYSS